MPEPQDLTSVLDCSKLPLDLRLCLSFFFFWSTLVAVPLLQNLYFNNFKCESQGSGNATNATVGSRVQQTQYKAITNGTTPTSSLYLEYTPIDYLNLPLNTPPFTQFLVR